MTLRAMREAAGMTQEEAAGLASMRQSAVSALENGRISNPTITTIENLARAYGQPIESVIAAVRASVSEAA
jgi:transcriptional regulator with XRE-family HTH domain